MIDLSPTAKAPAFILPPEHTFQSVFNLPWSVWPWQYDEALLNNVQNALRMRNDPTITAPLQVRTRATVLQEWHIEPDDDQDKIQVEAAADIEARLQRFPDLVRFMTSLMEALWYGRAGCQIQYEWDVRRSITGIKPREWEPINGDKLVFGFGEKRGKVGIRTWPAAPIKTEITDYGMVHWFDDNERLNIAVHQYERVDADFRRPNKAASIMGLGLRDQLYWYWALKNEFLGYMSSYTQWFSRGLTIYYYDSGNPESLAECTNRLNEHTKSGLPILLYPRTRDGGPSYAPVERVQANASNVDWLMNLVTNYFDQIMQKTILGATLLTGTGATGMGSGVANNHSDTFSQLVSYDTSLLAMTMTNEVIKTMYRYTYPSLTPGRFVFQSEKPNIEETINSASAFIEMGGQVDGDSLRKTLGLPPPTPGGQTLGGLQPMQASAVSQMPENTPVVQAPNDPDSLGPVASNDAA